MQIRSQSRCILCAFWICSGLLRCSVGVLCKRAELSGPKFLVDGVSYGGGEWKRGD